MTFFYDLNKRLADLGQKQTLSEGAVAERATGDYSATKARAGKDIGKPGKNFSKIAADAGKRYGSKAAGERVAGAVLNKLRHPKEDVEEGQLNELSPETIASYQKKAYPQATTTGPKSDQRTAGMVRSLGRPTNEADMEESALQAYLGDKKYGKEGMKALQQAGREHAGKEKMNQIRNRYDKMDEADMEEGNEFSGELAKAKAQHKDQFSVDGKTYPVKEEGGLPMTAKQKSFAALAPPKDKITFADKIAGAKKEVDEMLGDVAAEAMRNALGGRKQMADEGFDDMMSDVKKRMGPRVGDVKRGARHDIETTATGVRATRRYDDETDDQPSGEKRKAGRPKGAPKGPERVTAKAYKHKGGRVKEDGMMPGATDADAGEYGYEGDMAKDQIHTIVRHAKSLEKILSNREDLPEWVQAKLAKIEGMMTAVDDYMETQHERGAEMDQGVDLEEKAVSQQQQKFMGMAHAMQKGEKIKGASKELKKVAKTMKPKDVEDFAKTKHKGLPKRVEEESTDKEDQRAERAGKKVAKDIEYDEGHKGKDDNRAEKAGKKVTKDIEYDDKKDRKEKKVDETTTSGSVATGGDAPKASKGGLQIGKGIYDSLNRELENMISESMSINVSMTNDDNGSHKNITVTAADEDAEVLAQLLARAGLTGGGMQHDHGHQEPCPDCGSTDCGCDEAVEEAYGDVTATENKPDWPTDTEYSDDAMQYSGGLNKPKTDVAGDGQTTVPNTAVHTQDEDALRRMMEMAGIDQSKLKPWERTMKEEEAVEEGVVDKVKDVVKKGLEKLGHGSDEEMIKDLQKKTGVPQTGKKPEDKKMEESLMQEFANFRI